MLGLCSAEDYFRITLFDEFVSHIVVHLQESFIDNSGTCGLMYLLPQECFDGDSVPPEQLTSAVEYDSDDLPHPPMFSMEYEVWVKMWQVYIVIVAKYLKNFLIFSRIVVDCNFLTLKLYFR